MTSTCLICGFPAQKKLCVTHSKLYKWDKDINGFRLKKRTAGSRYNQAEYHKTEIRLTKLIEQYYGKSNVITSFHPMWALSNKNVLYEYDILIKSKKFLIEYNGNQHYQQHPVFHKDRSDFLLQVKRDKRKARLARKNNFKLIIFRYDEPIFKDYVIKKIEGA